jgi:hypothetical protein
MLLQVDKTQDLPNKIWQTLEVALKRHFFWTEGVPGISS